MTPTLKVLLAFIVMTNEHIIDHDTRPTLWALFWLEMEELTISDNASTALGKLQPYIKESVAAARTILRLVEDPGQLAAAQQHLDEILRVFPQWMCGQRREMSWVASSLRRLIGSQR